MGYRSDVGMVLSKTGSEVLFEKIKNSDDDTKEEVMKLLSYAEQYKRNNGERLWFWRDIKWYDGEPDIDFITNFLEELNSDDYLFYRLGEEYDDLEYNGDFYENSFNLHFSRSLNFNKDEE